MDIRSKEFQIQAEEAEISPDDLKQINSYYALAPLEAGQVYVRKLALCNDIYDRTGERFPRAYLERFAETLPGKPLLAHHDKGQYPLGRFFKAEVTVEPGKAGSPPVTWLYCWVYLVKTPGNQEVRTQIDAGVYCHVSIGFRWADLSCDLCSRSYFGPECSHVIDREYEGRRCTATYSGDTARVEAVEGSLVYLGAQYGAVIAKDGERKEEKQPLAQTCGVDPSLTVDGRLYRDDLRQEIRRTAGCVGAEQEAEMLVEALGEVPAERLKEVLSGYQRRFDRIFPPLGQQIQAAGVSSPAAYATGAPE